MIQRRTNSSNFERPYNPLQQKRMIEAEENNEKEFETKEDDVKSDESQNKEKRTRFPNINRKLPCKIEGTNAVLNAVQINIDDGTIKHKLTIHFNNEKKECSFFRSDMLPTPSDEVINNGFSVVDSKAFKENLLVAEKNSPTEYIHNTLGFSIYDDKKIFKAYSGVRIL